MDEDLISQLSKTINLLGKALIEARKRGSALAELERDYKVLLAKTILQLQEDGQRATVILDVAKGSPDVAEKKRERDVAEVVYVNAQEAINVYKKTIDCLREQIAREWGHA